MCGELLRLYCNETILYTHNITLVKRYRYLISVILLQDKRQEAIYELKNLKNEIDLKFQNNILQNLFHHLSGY